MESDGAHSGERAAGLGTAPLFHAAWLFAAGVVVSHALWLRPGWLLAALAPVAALCAVAALRAQRMAWLPVAALWLLLGAWCGLVQPQPAPEPHLAALSDGLMRTVEGTVTDAGPVRTEAELNVDEPTQSAPSQTITMRVASVEVVSDSEDRQAPAGGAVRLTVRWPQDAARAQGLRCGERIRADARLLLPPVYHDPGVWSRTDYLLQQGVTATASVTAERIERLGRADGVQVACRIAEWQHAVTARLRAFPARPGWLPLTLRLSGDDAAMLAALAAGDRTYLDHDLRVGFERTGSFHMLVVSGFHLAIVAGCLLWMMRRLRVPRVPATLLTLAGSFAYALFTGFATPVQRSLWMVTLYLLGRLIYREKSALNTLGFAALCLMAVNPASLFESSLQMTLLAVVSIAGVAAPLLESTVHPYLKATRQLRQTMLDTKLAPRLAQFRVTLRMFARRLQAAGYTRMGWSGLPGVVRFTLRCVELLVVSCVVELAMTLPMAVYFHRVTLMALPVNLLILPLLTVLLPAALLLLLTLVVWPAAAALPAATTALALHAGVGIVHLFGALRVAEMRIPAPESWQWAAFYGLLAVAVLLARGGPWMRRGCWVALALAGVAAVVPRPVEHPHGALLVEAIDVGQGDSLLLITPDGKTLLVDGGGFGGGPRQAPQNFDIGEDVVSPALWARGIRRLDAVALSHAHSDHMGGLPAVLRNFRPKELWVGNNPPVVAYEALLSEAEELQVRVRRLRAGDQFAFGATEVHALAPVAGYAPGAEPANNDSMVLHVAYGNTAALLEGDAEAPIEQAMLAEQGLGSTLLKVGHHGSASSTTPLFLARVRPEWAVISCGLHNRYGHPREEVLEALQAAHVRTYRTDTGGVACFALDGKRGEEEPLCEEGAIP